MGLCFGVSREALLCLEVLRTLLFQQQRFPLHSKPQHHLHHIPLPGHSSATRKIHCQASENPHPLANAITRRDLLPDPTLQESKDCPLSQSQLVAPRTRSQSGHAAPICIFNFVKGWQQKKCIKKWKRASFSSWQRIPSTSKWQQKPGASGKDRRGRCFLHKETQFVSRTCPEGCSQQNITA